MNTLKNLASIPFTIIGILIGIAWLLIALLFLDIDEPKNYHNGEY